MYVQQIGAKLGLKQIHPRLFGDARIELGSIELGEKLNRRRLSRASKLANPHCAPHSAVVLKVEREAPAKRVARDADVANAEVARIAQRIDAPRSRRTRRSDHSFTPRRAKIRRTSASAKSSGSSSIAASGMGFSPVAHFFTVASLT